MSIGSGIAIGSPWAAVAVAVFVSPPAAVFLAFFAMIASAEIASEASNARD